jgi:hypothetical protein
VWWLGEEKKKTKEKEKEGVGYVCGGGKEKIIIYLLSEKHKIMKICSSKWMIFFFIVDINLKHNVILYFLDLFFCINIKNENFFVVEDFVC